MKKRLFSIITIAIMFISIISLSGCNKKEDNKKLKIVTSNFPSFDLARAVVKDNKNIDLKMLLKPGSDMHHFDATPKDIKDILNSDVFIYNGGESDEWIDKILKDIDKKKTTVIKLMDLVKVVEEEHVEGMEEEHDHDHDHDHDSDKHDHDSDKHDHDSDKHDKGHDHDEEEKEYDEHVWTSPVNAKKIVSSIKEAMIKKDAKNKNIYEKSASEYISELDKIDNEFKEIVKNAKRKEIVFGDRFPLRYFVDTYGLKYSAAFPGCSEETEASAKTIKFLVNKVKDNKIPVVFHIELSDKEIASSIAKETGAKVLEFKTAHNLSQKDFDKGVTYLDIMKDNIKVLKEALN